MVQCFNRLVSDILCSMTNMASLIDDMLWNDVIAKGGSLQILSVVLSIRYEIKFYSACNVCTSLG